MIHKKNIKAIKKSFVKHFQTIEQKRRKRFNRYLNCSHKFTIAKTVIINNKTSMQFSSIVLQLCQLVITKKFL